MDYTANLGPLAFQYVDAVHAVLPPFEASVRFATAENEVATIHDGDRCFLVIDHRVKPMTTARVEYWTTTSVGEAPVHGLFVLADAARAGSRADYFGSLGSLADLLSGAPLAENALSSRSPSPVLSARQD